MNRLEVRTSKFPLFMLGVLGVFFALLTAGLLVNMISGGVQLVPVAIAASLFIMFLLVLGLYVRGHRRTVKFLSDLGLTRNDGREFQWSQLDRVVNKVAVKPGSTAKRLWRTEIQFAGGDSAWLIPSKVSNFDEVYAYVSNLQCEHVQEDA